MGAPSFLSVGVQVRPPLPPSSAPLISVPEFEYACRVSEALRVLRLKVLGLRSMYQPLRDARTGGRGFLLGELKGLRGPPLQHKGTDPSLFTGYAGVQYLLKKFSTPHKAANQAISAYNTAATLYRPSSPVLESSLLSRQSLTSS